MLPIPCGEHFLGNLVCGDFVKSRCGLSSRVESDHVSLTLRVLLWRHLGAATSCPLSVPWPEVGVRVGPPCTCGQWMWEQPRGRLGWQERHGAGHFAQGAGED